MRIRISPANPTCLNENTLELMEKEAVFLGCGLHSPPPGSTALGGWLLWMLRIQVHGRSAGAGC